MATDIIVPQMGESVLEGTIVEWKVAEGDKVTKDQPLVELATDKINIEIPSEVSGVIGKLLAAPGETVQVGAKVAVILAEGESAGAISASSASDAAPAASAPVQKAAAQAPIGFGAPAASSAAVATAPPPTGASNGRTPTGAKGSGKMAPAVRKLVREYGVDPKEVAPTGPKGRLTKEDILDFVAARSTVTATPAAPSAGTTVSAPAAPATPTAAIPQVSFAPLAAGERERREPASGPRKAIAEHMVRSKSVSAHVTTFEECDLTELWNFRAKHKNDIMARYGVNVTFMPFIVKAVCTALKEFPLINASMTDSEIIYKNYYNIGVAVGRDAGLIVPVVHDADKKSILQLASEVATLSANANSNKLSPNDLMDGTFTITNAGMFGATGSTPIISQPQVCILGVHNIRKMPWVVETKDGDEIQIRRIINFGLSFDHRLVDGHIAVQFLHRVCGLLTDPAHMLVYA